MSRESSKGAAVPGEAAPAGGVGEWAATITDSELPLFAQNLSDISSVATARQSSAADLAGAITMDVSMSVRLLKIANSPVLNPQDRDIDSVRTAVVLMGFDAVRDLAFSLSLVSELHRDGSHGRLMELLAHGFHAATVAQALARLRKDRYPEEAFVAGLLLYVGEMAFWSRERAEGARIEARMADGETREAAEKGVLGFNLRELSRRLAEDWRMGGLLRMALAGPADEPRCESLQLADQAAAVAEAHGWRSAPGQAMIERLADQLKMPHADLESVLQNATEAATRMARRFGVESVERLLNAAPPELAVTDRQSTGAREVMPADRHSTGVGLEIPLPDPQAELDAVRSLQAELRGKPDIDRLMRLALHGLHAGAGVDRAFFAMLSTDRSRLCARYAAGRDEADVLDQAEFPLARNDRQLFSLLLKSGKVVWIDSAHRQRLADLIGPEVERWAAGNSFFAMPIFVRGRPVGLLYADRAASGRELDDAAFTSFRYFGDQITAGLTHRTG